MFKCKTHTPCDYDLDWFENYIISLSEIQHF